MQLVSKGRDDGIASLLNLLKEEATPYKIGDSVQCKGRLSFYKGEWKIFANFVRLISLNEESYHCIELDHLYKKVYKAQ